MIIHKFDDMLPQNERTTSVNIIQIQAQGCMWQRDHLIAVPSRSAAKPVDYINISNVARRMSEIKGCISIFILDVPRKLVYTSAEVQWI